MLQKLKIHNIEVSYDLRVCDGCRMRISKLPDPSAFTHEVDADQTASCSVQCDALEESSSANYDSEKSSDCVESSRTDNVEKLNESLVSLGETPIKKKKILQKNIVNRNCRK